MKRIGIDARFALWKVRGTGRYVRELLKYLAAIDETNQYYIYVDREDIESILPKKDNFIVRKLHVKLWPVFEQIILPFYLYIDKINIFHAPGSTSPIFLPKGIKLILTIFDVVFLKPNSPKPGSFYQKLGKIYRRLFVPIVGKRADSVITASQAQKEDVIKYIKKIPSQMKVIHLGISEFERRRELAQSRGDEIWASLQKKYAIKGPFIFVVGGTAPVKLTLEAIKVFEIMSAKCSEQNPYMVIAGLGGDSNTYLHQYVRQNNLSRVVFTEYLSDEELIILYSRARVFLYFLVSNGFELPIVEAMSCGAPCVFSNTPPIPELYGGAGIIVDHFNFEQVAAELESLFKNEVLFKELKQKSLARAAQFSSKKMAAETLKLYKNYF